MPEDFAPLAHFQVISDFNAQSAKQVCYVSNLPLQKRRTPQQQDHEIDEFVLRGPEISFEGYLDLRPAVILETAAELGMVSAAKHEALRGENLLLRQELDNALARLDEANERLQGMILLNAEQIVQEEALAEELTQAYEDLYDPHELSHVVDEQRQERLEL